MHAYMRGGGGVPYLWYSTFHPSLRMFSMSSRIVRTFAPSTAVHVGTIAPSPASVAAARQRSVRTLRNGSVLTDLVVREHESAVPGKLNVSGGQRFVRGREAHLFASTRMSVFSRSSIASRFSARSESFSVRRGSEASRSTNGRPEIYTGAPGECSSAANSVKDKTETKTRLCNRRFVPQCLDSIQALDSYRTT